MKLIDSLWYAVCRIQCLLILVTFLTGCEAMQSTEEFCLVLTTCPNQLEADTHAKAIVEQRLGACVQSSAISSYFMWEGEAQSEAEVLLLIKTTCARYEALEHYLASAHSYEVPQIIRIPVAGGLNTYLDWVRQTTSGDNDKPDHCRDGQNLK